MNHILFDTNKPNGRKHFQQLLNTLLDYNSDKDEEYYNDIHIYQEESFIVLEWEHVPYSHEWGGKFQYIDEGMGQVVMIEKTFPDNHYELCYDEEDYEERLKDWLKDNPYWEKTSYGTWTNVEENRRFFLDYNAKKLFEKEESPDDCSFKVVFAKDDDFNNSLSSILKLVDSDILRRTSCVVISKDLIDTYYKDDIQEEHIGADNEGLYKLGILSLEYKLCDYFKEETTQKDDIHVYVDFDVDVEKSILFVTDTNYIICKLTSNSKASK